MFANTITFVSTNAHTDYALNPTPAIDISEPVKHARVIASPRPAPGCEVENYGYNHNDYISCLKCRRDGGGSEFASLVISTCPTKELANRNGRLVCAGDAEPAAADTLPPATEPAQPAHQPTARDTGGASGRKSAGGTWRSNE